MNSISVNLKDDKIPEIVQLGKLNIKTKTNFRVYGTKQAEHPAVWLEYDAKKVSPAEVRKLSNLKSFFTKNRVSNAVDILNPEQKNKHAVYIGLRTDLRNNLKVSNAI